MRVGNNQQKAKEKDERDEVRRTHPKLYRITNKDIVQLAAMLCPKRKRKY